MAAPTISDNIMRFAASGDKLDTAVRIRTLIVANAGALADVVTITTGEGTPTSLFKVVAPIGGTVVIPIGEAGGGSFSLGFGWTGGASTEVAAITW